MEFGEEAKRQAMKRFKREFQRETILNNSQLPSGPINKKGKTTI